jgi:hypothetical protein
MKHIFLIHSHTLFLTSLGVIEYLKLDKDQVIFIYSRNYKTMIETSYLTIDMSEECENCFHAILSFSRKNYRIDKKLKKNIINKVDKTIDIYVTDNFKLYIPHLQIFFCQIFATNKKCIGCNFIQEGGRVMYNLLTDKNLLFFRLYNAVFLRNEKRMWKTASWFPSKNCRFNKPIRVYAVDNSFFNNFVDDCHIVKWPRLEISYNIETEYPIFVYEGAVELGQIERHHYFNAIKKQIDDFSSKKNYVKFHPAQTDKAKKIIKNFFMEKEKEMIELPMDIPFELLIISNTNLNIYGFGSSLLFFSRAYGHNVTSNEEYLLISKRYKYYCNKIMRF